MNGQQYLQAASAIAALAPVFDSVITLVFNTARGIEAAMPQSTGAQKLDAALNMIGSIYGAAKAEAAPAFTGLINAAVAVMNVRGELQAIKAGALAVAPGTASPSPQPGSST